LNNMVLTYRKITNIAEHTYKLNRY
jgi:hypothetical protein